MRHRPRVVPSEPPPANPVLARWGREARDLLFNFCARAFCTLALVAAFWLSAQAQEAVPLARGNTPGEPHHHLKIENEYVRVYYVEVPPHEDTQLHQHDHDYIYVSLGRSDVVNAVLNKPEIHLQLMDGETHFTRGGFAHVARNLADTPFRNITIELLKPQGEPENHCAQIAPGAANGACDNSLSRFIDTVVAEQQFATAESILELVRLKPKAEFISPTPSLLVVLDNSEVQVSRKGKPRRTLHKGEVIWLEANSRISVSNPSETPSSFLQLTLRSGSTAGKP